MIEEFLRNAYCIAAQSRDSSSQNGATLVSNGEIIGTGSNNFPIGVEFNAERASKRPDKYRFFEHAERNAIYSAARAGLKVFESVMFCPWAACCDCARGVINSGVASLVVHQERMDMTPERWQDNVDDALNMMTEAGITIIRHKGPVHGCPDILVDGQLWNPDLTSSPIVS